MQQQELKELLDYHPDTGEFFWKVRPSNRVQVGAKAGNKSNGYILIRVKGILHYAHRLAFLYMTGSWPTHLVDHDNHNRSDNRWSNLKQADTVQNQRNCSLSRNNISGINGVHWEKRRQKWRAVISVNYTNKFLGDFSELADAIAARQAANTLHGFHPNHGSPKQ